MRTATYTPNIIKMGISDYLSMSIDKGKLYFHNLKVHEDLPDWIESSDVDVGVELGYVHNYVVPSGQGIIFEMNNLDLTGNFLVEILNTGSPTNYPDFLIENYSGEYQFQNKFGTHTNILAILPNTMSRTKLTYGCLISELGKMKITKSKKFHSKSVFY